MTARTALLALSLILGTAPLASAEQPTAAQTPAVAPPSISVVKAERREIVASVPVTGTFVPRETVSVGADVEGLRIEELLADEGDTVKAGQVIARLATDLVDADLARATAQIARADAAITQARAQVEEAESANTEAASALQRTRALSAKGIVGQDILDQRVSAAAAATARLASARQGIALAEADRASAEADRRSLELRRSKAEVKAPTDGLVLARSARLGAVVSAAAGPLFEIARDGLIELDAEVSETQLGAIEKGQPASVRLPGRDESVAGEVRLVSPKVDQATRLGRVFIALPPSPALRSGSFARGSVETARSEGVVIARTAVLTDEGVARVQVVKDGRIETRQVKTGLVAGDEVEITDNLQPDEDVVSLAGTFVRDGDAVTPIATDSETQTAEAAR
ncbi:efflux RND transporter periplasmic adaptor subunit [Aureimonas phyllosphaerae]|uniref:RND family efflux transporter MFP subunit n=1 Tax=Aureimonas phyllosphaerae TaxID=1166078 RepID=A0A7W6FUH6_9HYPH|nr:efflux RND transporter periplasmic adaptor subunit [Aureimonas phyllosphaerae]MBB3936078.1 RND family efflux transporter MFP subunit [Aureimonas phyllosphaerae]MBB3960197.1 RND family efflux transporter MFP subunit [Aureimonas phyllosphaerae]SFF34206.1 RND family efflux transporter, MFP subunit [Aureimonas phyllosphaerae]